GARARPSGIGWNLGRDTESSISASFRIARHSGVSAIDSHKPTREDRLIRLRISCRAFRGKSRMKFTYEAACECGGRIVFSTTGEEKFGPGECSSCKKTAYLTDPLSVSVTAERLLYRSKAELENGDYSLSIVIATIAVESYLTRLFLKL